MRPKATAALLLLAAAAGCGGSTGPRRLWLNVPRDGVVTLEDREPPPF